jgi:uncharacterized cupredoxin-like copper-binding protein
MPRVLAGLAACLLLAAGCGSSRTQHASSPARGVNERDFHITAPAALRAGDYTFSIHNEGSTDHELILVRSATGASLPLRADGLTVDEETIAHLEPGSLPPGAPGAVRPLAVHLSPGRYTFFCNMEGHYMAGMHAELVVS